jgi:hypothetical protein
MIYYEKYDSLWDAKKGRWLEPKCGNINCEFCSIRPDKPLKKDALNAEMENNRSSFLSESTQETTNVPA